ncbi:KH domain [Popillia japonica]|uniref:KH domain n=1 Tax=Popillia japonica TaxID=7064 RepID=A0AAW1JC10_POPJA
MAPSQPRQLLVWTLPTIALILTKQQKYKRRIRRRYYRHYGRQRLVTESFIFEELEDAITDTTDGSVSSPNRSFSRSLSGVDSAPIDIIIPRELRSHKSNPIVISDEDLDIEIQKIKSMKSAAAEPFKKSKSSDDVDSMKKTPPSELRRSEKSKEFSTPVDSFTSTPITPKYKSPKVIKCTPQKIILSSSSSPMAQKHAKSSPEEKLTTAKVDTQEKIDSPKKMPTLNSVEEKNVENEEMQRQNVERDSANHSPADVMLASPSLSSISDNHSEGSNDSGKGGSDVATPPSRTPANDGSILGDVPSQFLYEFSIPQNLGSNDSGKGGSDVATPPSRTPANDGSILGDVPSQFLYEFSIPQNLVGRLIGRGGCIISDRLIGRGGCIISDIKEKTRTRIMIKKHPSNSKMKICAIEGSQINIDTALQMIREKFPLKRYPEVTLEQMPIHAPVALTPDQLHLKLIEGINNDTIISCMVAPNHFFVQQPTHPTFLNLNILSNCMNHCYNSADSPLLPKPIVENTICAAQSEGDWYRVMVMSSDTDANTSYVIFLDYGGYAYIENSKLRQIRGDFLMLPFQAAECILANVRPLAGERWSDEAYSIVAELTKGALTYTQVADYTNEGVPLVLMYIFVGPQEVVFLNEELVNRGLAEWVPLTQQDETEGAVGGVVS